jgi:uncharacterized surface protein with fasciclin (FAS1) repeats
MKRAAIAGFAAGAAMMIGGALGAVSRDTPQAAGIDPNSETMNPMIGGQAMMPDRDAVENMAASPQHTQLAAALKESGVAQAFHSNGQFTLFAPTDAAFAAAPGVMRDKAGLARRISYLVVPGKYDSATLLRLIEEGGGQAKLRTVEGGVIVARLNGPTNILLSDEKGATADIAIYDIRDRNGIIHVVDRVIEPAGPSRQVASN